MILALEQDKAATTRSAHRTDLVKIHEIHSTVIQGDPPLDVEDFFLDTNLFQDGEGSQ